MVPPILHLFSPLPGCSVPPAPAWHTKLSLHLQGTWINFPHSPPSPGAAGGPRAPRTRNSGSRSRRTRGGLAQRWGRGFRFSVRLTPYLRPPGRDFTDYRESPVNLIRFGPQARKGASVKRAPASLLLRICGLCGHRCAAQGELGVFQDQIFTARSQRNAQILWILPVNVCWDVYALGGSVRK